MIPKIVVITGPTATGKTGLGVALGKAMDGEVVSADSMQLYRYMDIGTAKPTLEEMDGVPHHMLDVVSPNESYSVSRYVEMASRCVEDILDRDKLPILVGGTGMYIDALISGLDFAPSGLDSGLREELGRQYDSFGPEKMVEMLRSFDPDSARRLHPNDKKRIVRAVEIYLQTGVTMTEHDRQTRLRLPRYDALKIALDYEDRQDLYARIDRRVGEMLDMGLVREVQALLDMGLGLETTAMQAIGYKEIAAHLMGKCTLEEAADLVRQESRRYAKRQLSWLRRDPGVKWIRWTKRPDFDEAVRISTGFLREHGIMEPTGGI